MTEVAKMASDPNVVTVYFTEKGFDSEAIDVVFPDYKIMNDALSDGYSWWDITTGRLKHMQPKYRPYKIVEISSAELKVMRDKEAAAAKLARIAAKADAILQDIMDLPPHLWNEMYLVEFVAKRCVECIADDREELMERICGAVEHEGLLFRTPDPSRPSTPSTPSTITDVSCIEMNDVTIDGTQYILEKPAALPSAEDFRSYPQQLQNPPSDLREFVNQPGFVWNNMHYTPIATMDGTRMYVPSHLVIRVDRSCLMPRHIDFTCI